MEAHGAIMCFIFDFEDEMNSAKVAQIYQTGGDSACHV